MAERSAPRSRILVRLSFSAVPIQASLGVLGRKWALRVLMTIALGQAQRFNTLLRTTPGMSKRILAMRLRDLEQDGFIDRAEQGRGYTRWQITQKGADVLPVLLTLVQFGVKWGGAARSPAEAPASWGPAFEVTYSRPGRGRRRR